MAEGWYGDNRALSLLKQLVRKNEKQLLLLNLVQNIKMKCEFKTKQNKQKKHRER